MLGEWKREREEREVPEDSVKTALASTEISSHLMAKLRDWADRQAEAGCYSWAVLTSNDSKTRYYCTWIS